MWLLRDGELRNPFLSTTKALQWLILKAQTVKMDVMEQLQTDGVLGKAKLPNVRGENNDRIHLTLQYNMGNWGGVLDNVS